MISVSAKELKNETGKVLRWINAGQRVVITMRKKPFAVLSPFRVDEVTKVELRPFEEAWKDIEQTLEGSSPAFSSLTEAMRWTRKRP